MTFLPIVGRELRVASRRSSTFWSRTAMAAICIGIGVFIFIVSSQEASSEMGKTLFATMAGLCFLHAILVGVRHTADCLSEEKREGTLGLLFLTDLKGYDVVFGKLFSTSINSFYGLLALMPIMAIPMLMGGITNGELWRVALLLVNTFFFSLSAGMFFSSISKDSRKAMGCTFVFLLFFTVGFPLLVNAVRFFNKFQTLEMLSRWVNPGYCGALVEDLEYRAKSHEFWISLGCVHAMGWLLLVLACIIVPRSWQDRPSGAKAQSAREKMRALTDGGSHERLSRRRRLLDINAFYWLAAHRRFKQFWLWVAFASVGALWVWGYEENKNEWVGVPNYFLTCFCLNSFLKAFFASESVRRLGEDRKTGSLELLLSTSLTVSDIIKGQLLALRRHFVLPLIFVLTVETVYFFIAVHSESTSADDMGSIVAYAMAMMILLIADIAAMAFVGMWNGLTAANPARAAGMTFRKVVFYPVAATFIISALVSVMILVPMSRMGSSGPGSGFNPAWVCLALYFIPSIIADIGFGTRALNSLNTQFRHAATQRYAGAGSGWTLFWSRFWGAIYRKRTDSGAAT
jgi:ABC-type transport system involved in multi-copper enzyme maturation permease subunit